MPQRALHPEAGLRAAHGWLEFRGVLFRSGPDGEEIDAGEDWDPLVARLDAALPDGDDVQIIWP